MLLETEVASFVVRVEYAPESAWCAYVHSQDGALITSLVGKSAAECMAQVAALLFVRVKP